MKFGQEVIIKNQSQGDFRAFVVKSDDLYEIADVTLEKPDTEDSEFCTMTFSYSDIELVD